MKIFLIGFMGCGKTYTGKELASNLEYEFLDMDDEVINIAGKSIPDIFSEDGESVFREYERKVMLNMLKKDNAVIATGGGAPCYADSMELINKTGISVYLQLSSESLAKRLEHKKQTRPLVASKNAKDLRKFIAETLEKREPYYMKAHYIVSENNINANYILKLIF